MPPCVAAHASCMKRPLCRTTFKPSSKLIAPAAVNAVNSPSDSPAVAWKLSEGTRSLSSSKAAQLTRKTVSYTHLPGDFGDAALAGNQVGPEGINLVTQRSNDPEAGDDYAAVSPIAGHKIKRGSLS